MSTPTVAILHLRTTRPAAPAFQAELDMLNAATAQAVRELGWRPHLVATAEVTSAETLAAAREADMVVLMGGEDVDPRLYGGADDYPGAGPHEARADGVQIAVALEAVQQRRPLLGICRGLQLLNVAFGGTLVQHLPTVHNHRAHGRPADPFMPTHVLLDAEAGLGVDVDPDDPVLCTHHQAVDQLGNGLRVAARAADGVIEAVVHETAPITGVQWHPEHPRTAASQLTALLRRMARQRTDAPAGV